MCALFNVLNDLCTFFVQRFILFLHRAFTSKVQIVGGVDDNPHQREVESGHLGSDFKLDTAMV